MASFFSLGQLYGGQLFELFTRETNLKKQSSVGLNWQCFLAGSSKTAMGADYSFELISIVH